MNGNTTVGGGNGATPRAGWHTGPDDAGLAGRQRRFIEASVVSSKPASFHRSQRRFIEESRVGHVLRARIRAARRQGINALGRRGPGG
jgi:hypothetical protein